MALQGRKVVVRVSGAPLTLTNAATTADGGRLNYQITNAAQRVLHPTAAMTVQTSPDGTTWSAAADFTLNRLTGTVSFTVARAVGTQIRVSGQYLPLAAVIEGTAATLALRALHVEPNQFGDTFVLRSQNQKDASGTITKWRTTDATFDLSLIVGEPFVVIEYAFDGVTRDALCWGLLNGTELSGSLTDLQEEAVSWEAFEDADGRVISFV